MHSHAFIIAWCKYTRSRTAMGATHGSQPTSISKIISGRGQSTGKVTSISFTTPGETSTSRRCAKPTGVTMPASLHSSELKSDAIV